MNLDIDIAKRLKKGDSKALKLFFDNFYPSVYVYGRHYIERTDVLEDIIMDAFVGFWNIRESFLNIRKIREYIYISVRNGCINYIKQKEKRKKILTKDIELQEKISYELIIEEESYRLLYSAINKLPKKTKEIILMSLKNYKNPEIAKSMGVSINTVKTLKKNAYSKLRNQLSKILAIILAVF